MTSDAARAALAVFALLSGVAGCATRHGDDEPRQYLDEQTAATVTVAAQPIVFARERPELAVNARDYLTLVPVDVNRAGTHSVYFYGYVWSTIDQRDAIAETAATPPGGFELVADGRRIPLTPAATLPREVGLGEAPVAAPARGAVVLVTAVNRETLEFLADASEVRAVRTTAGLAAGYELWRDGRPAIEGLLQAVPASRP